MAENAQTLTRQESAARAGAGQGRQKQGRVTDAERRAERSGAGIASGQTGPGDGKR